MTPENWKQIKTILEEAVERSPASRSSFVEKACYGNESLRREVVSMLDFDHTRMDLLEQSAFSSVMENGSHKTAKSLIGKQIGSYKIIGELGAGGMGAVYLAERADGAFQQKAALKLIKRGMDSDAILDRFINERQILASLKHPNIAHLIDGGSTEDDLPYFVMEYIEGSPITEYAERENLDLEARLRLFREVCAAVTFAHSNLVIHRDLKPSNILVTRDGKVKLLDFGIAKLVKSDAEGETVTRNFVLTPEYASPEQVRGEKLTTATDVYSLGVILYELLTGSRPYQTDGSNIGAIIRAVCETEPKRPSSAAAAYLSEEAVSRKRTVRNHWQTTADAEPQTKTNSKASGIRNPKSLKGDLDNIILKALRKEAEKRYSSVEQLSEDIRRHQSGLPVKASKDTWNYRTAKFVRRNRIGMATAGLIFLSMLGGLGATIYQSRIAQAEREKAERRFNDVRKLANSFMFEINEEIERSPVKARELLVARALEYLDKLAQESSGNVELQSELASAYEKIGDVQSALYHSNIGDSKGALESYSKALEQRKSLFADDEKNVEFASNLALSHTKMGEIFAKTGNIAAAIENHRQAVRMNKQVAGREQSVENRRRLGRSYSMLGQAVLRTGKLSEVLESYKSAQAIYEDMASENTGDPKSRRSLSIIYMYIGYVLIEMGDFDGGTEFYKKSLVISQKILQADGSNKRALELVASSHWHIGLGLRYAGKPQESLDHFNKSLQIAQNRSDDDPEDKNLRNNLGDCYLEIANTQADLGQFAAAFSAYDKTIENYKIVQKSDEGNAHVRRQIAYTLRHKADALARKGETDAALKLYQEAVQTFQELAKNDVANIERQYDFAAGLLKYGEALARKGDVRGAREKFEQALPAFENLIAQSSENVRIQRDFHTVRSRLAGD